MPRKRSARSSTPSGTHPRQRLTMSVEDEHLGVPPQQIRTQPGRRVVGEDAPRTPEMEQHEIESEPAGTLLRDDSRRLEARGVDSVYLLPGSFPDVVSGDEPVGRGGASPAPTEPGEILRAPPSGSQSGSRAGSQARGDVSRSGGPSLGSRFPGRACLPMAQAGSCTSWPIKRPLRSSPRYPTKAAISSGPRSGSPCFAPPCPRAKGHRRSPAPW